MRKYTKRLMFAVAAIAIALLANGTVLAVHDII